MTDFMMHFLLLMLFLKTNINPGNAHFNLFVDLYGFTCFCNLLLLHKKEKY